MVEKVEKGSPEDPQKVTLFERSQQLKRPGFGRQNNPLPPPPPLRTQKVEMAVAGDPICVAFLALNPHLSGSVFVLISTPNPEFFVPYVFLLIFTY